VGDGADGWGPHGGDMREKALTPKDIILMGKWISAKCAITAWLGGLSGVSGGLLGEVGRSEGVGPAEPDPRRRFKGKIDFRISRIS
jgi:hypothetical protein